MHAEAREEHLNNHADAAVDIFFEDAHQDAERKIEEARRHMRSQFS